MSQVRTNPRETHFYENMKRNGHPITKKKQQIKGNIIKYIIIAAND